jgi:hypothetical protein
MNTLETFEGESLLQAKKDFVAKTDTVVENPPVAAPQLVIPAEAQPQASVAG